MGVMVVAVPRFQQWCWPGLSFHSSPLPIYPSCAFAGHLPLLYNMPWISVCKYSISFDMLRNKDVQMCDSVRRVVADSEIAHNIMWHMRLACGLGVVMKCRKGVRATWQLALPGKSWKILSLLSWFLDCTQDDDTWGPHAVWGWWWSVGKE